MPAMADDDQVGAVVLCCGDDLGCRLTTANLAVDGGAGFAGQSIAQQSEFVLCRREDHDARRIPAVFNSEEFSDGLLLAAGQTEDVKQCHSGLTLAGQAQRHPGRPQGHLGMVNGAKDTSHHCCRTAATPLPLPRWREAASRFSPDATYLQATLLAPAPCSWVGGADC
jgi:hypothetical protein